jgi:hypothetical protein
LPRLCHAATVLATQRARGINRRGGNA